jgi:hypothetical protein
VPQHYGSPVIVSLFQEIGRKHQWDELVKEQERELLPKIMAERPTDRQVQLDTAVAFAFCLYECSMLLRELAARGLVLLDQEANQLKKLDRAPIDSPEKFEQFAPRIESALDAVTAIRVERSFQYVKADVETLLHAKMDGAEKALKFLQVLLARIREEWERPEIIGIIAGTTLGKICGIRELPWNRQIGYVQHFMENRHGPRR